MVYSELLRGGTFPESVLCQSGAYQPGIIIVSQEIEHVEDRDELAESAERGRPPQHAPHSSQPAMP